tara:strand:+ start:2338 stop:3039 length:702 start_codon:yes stop_codon:yes gene_type:complete
MNIQSLIDKLFRRDPKMKPNLCYSQNGEDLILNRLLENKEKGFFIDVGAHHPIRFSNTYLFYKKGWSGINIDAMPGSMTKFNKIRPKDINIECGVGLKNDQLTFYQFNETALNTFSKKEALSKNKDGYKIIKSNFLQVESLENLLDKYMPRNTKIDFLNIDVEGKDEEVLISNNWEKYKPNYILVEILREKYIANPNSSIKKFLKSIGYIPINKIFDTYIFKNFTKNEMSYLQ